MKVPLRDCDPLPNAGFSTANTCARAKLLEAVATEQLPGSYMHLPSGPQHHAGTMASVVLIASGQPMWRTKLSLDEGINTLILVGH